MATYVPPLYEIIPTVYLPDTFPEKQHRNSHLPFPYWRHKAARWLHDPDNDEHVPSLDVRETQSHYYLDIELPGISNKSKLNVRWTTTRSLLVQARSERPHLSECQSTTGVGTEGTASKPETDDKGENIATDNSCTCVTTAKQGDHALSDHVEPPASDSTKAANGTATADPAKSPIHLTVAERRIGFFHRSFSFPVDVEYEGMKAKLEHGLLSLSVAKKAAERVEKGKETVQLE